MENIHPQIVRSQRKSLSLEIRSTGEVIVKAPLHVSDKTIQAFLHEKEEWLVQNIAVVRARMPQKKMYQEGEIFYFLGKPYSLVYTDELVIHLTEDKLLLPKVMLFRAQKELTNWYLHQAKETISKRVAFHAEKMQTAYTKLLFSDTKSKWGTCFPDNSLQFNWRLIMAPLIVLDYVVIHELAHTTEKNHGDVFWRKVRLYTPAYRQHRKWLEENAQLLVI